MLLYIYGGVLDLDPACSIGGLVMAADMYDIVGMKSIISFTLNKDYCHFFHKVGLTLYALMNSSFWFETSNLVWSNVYIEGSQVIFSK